jgi:hypothetical protein
MPEFKSEFKFEKTRQSGIDTTVYFVTLIKQSLVQKCKQVPVPSSHSINKYVNRKKCFLSNALFQEQHITVKKRDLQMAQTNKGSYPLRYLNCILIPDSLC